LKCYEFQSGLKNVLSVIRDMSTSCVVKNNESLSSSVF